MNRWTMIGVWALVLSIICLPVCAQQIDEREVVISHSVETTYFHGPIPIRLASSAENDISMERALQIAQEIATNVEMISQEVVEQCTRSVHYAILSNVEESYHIGGWIVTYFLSDSSEDVLTIILEGASGDVLFDVRGWQSGVGWMTRRGLETGEDWMPRIKQKGIVLGRQDFLWPVEWLATFDAVCVFPDATRIHHVLPSENDIPQTEALEIAKAAVREEYGLSEQEIEQYRVRYWLLSNWEIYEPGVKDTVWNLGFTSMEQGENGYWFPSTQYSVVMWSKDGEVISVGTP